MPKYNFSRRDILRLLAAGVPTLSAIGASGCSDGNSSNGGDVLVIGAGIAGLRAAEVLAQAGRNVIVLEARDRIGGRIFTDRSWGMPIDIGASWIHGITNNPITNRVASENIATVPFDYEAVVYGPDNQPRPAGTMDMIRAQIEQLIADAQAGVVANDEPLRTALDRAITNANLDAATRLDVEMGITAEIEEEYAADADELSANYFNEGAEVLGGDVLFPGGYDAVPKAVAGSLDIRLGHIVSSIDTSGDGAVVTTSKGTFEASAVIVTVPLGVLKAGTISFKPGLSTRKQQAIDNLGMGALSKTYLRFPSSFWPADAEVLTFIRTGDQQVRWVQAMNFEPLVNAPVLLVLNAGDFARAEEAMSDQQAIDSVMAALQQTFPQAPQPEAILRSPWTTDPFTLGSYSYLAVGSTQEDRDALAVPEGVLFFAGEACSLDHAGSVHGAWASGEAAANAVLAEV